jgi:hypothetical protein
MSIDERHELPSHSASLRQEIERLTRVAVESTNKHRSIAEKAMLLRDTLVTLSDEDSFAEPIVALVNDALAQYDLLVHGDTEFSRTEARTLKAENQRLAARLREQQAENVLLRGELRASEDHSGITNVVEQMQVQLGKERDAREGAESSLTTLQGALKAKAEEWRTRGNVLCPIEKTPPKNGWTTKQFMERPLGGILCAHANELDALRASSASGPAHCECRQPDFVALAGKPETTTCVRCQKPPKPEARADEQERSE